MNGSPHTSCIYRGSFSRTGNTLQAISPHPLKYSSVTHSPDTTFPFKSLQGNHKENPNGKGHIRWVLKAFTTLWVPLGCLY